jgi:hypothetical protein
MRLFGKRQFCAGALRIVERDIGVGASAALRVCERVVGAMTMRMESWIGPGSQDVRRVVCRTTTGCRLIATDLFDWND